MKADVDVARSLAHRAVWDALIGRRFASDSLAVAEARERRALALATEIALGALRHVITIEHVLSVLARYDARRVSPPLRAALLTGAYQLVWLADVPAYAAVDESVALARRAAGPRAAGMVNAVLRRLSGAILHHRAAWVRLDAATLRVSWHEACVFDRPVLPAEPLAQLATAAGETEPRFAALVGVLGIAAAEQVAWASQAVPAVAVHRNPLGLSPSEFAARVASELGADASIAGDSAFVRSAARVLESPLFREGQVHIQDPTARDAARRLAARPGETILDLCAAPGGKALVIAQAMENRGRVIATDATDERLARVRANSERMGLSCIETRRLGQVDPELGFDAAIVDAPCTNTGVIARRPEARLTLTRRKVASLVPLQRDLLGQAAARVRPGGRVVYATCSIERGENEEVVQAFLSQHPDWSPAAASDTGVTTLPRWGERLCDWRDGGFSMLLLRRA